MKKVFTVIRLIYAKKLIFDYEKSKEQQIILKPNLGAFYRYVNRQVALLWQRDCATCLSVEILQLQNIPIVWHYLRDHTFSRFYIIPECDRHTHRNGRTDTRRWHVLR